MREQKVVSSFIAVYLSIRKDGFFLLFSRTLCWMNSCERRQRLQERRAIDFSIWQCLACGAVRL
ncbi:MAG: hypothetical protein ACI4C1_07590 [Lachnospiraceae bacterium]